MRTKRLLRNRSALTCRTLYQNKDQTYTVDVEKFNTDLKCTHSYWVNFGMFGEALEFTNYKDTKRGEK